MWKYTYAFGIVVIFSLAVAVGIHDERNAQESTESAAPIAKAATSVKSNESYSQKYIEDAERYLPSIFYGFFRWPGGTEVWIIALTLFAIAKQAQENANATKAMRDSVILQEKALKQWIEITNWRVQTFSIIDVTFLDIQVDIVNPTSYPITLADGELLFTNPEMGGKVGSHQFTENTFLPPKIPLEANVALEITAAQAENFPTTSMNVTIYGSFNHIGVLEKPTVQKLWGTLACAQDWTKFTPQFHMNPRRPNKGEQKWDPN